MTKRVPQKSDKKSFWTPKRLILTFAVFTLFAAFGLANCSRSTDVVTTNMNAKAPATAPAKPASAPASNIPPLPSSVLNTEMKDLSGKTFKLSDYAGKVVVVNLWATWCGPCRTEIPELIKLSDDYKSRGVEFIGLTNEDPVEDEALVKDFVAKQKITYRIGWGDRSFETALMQGDIRNVIPQSFVITGDGRIIKRFVGFNPEMIPQKLRQAIEEAINFKG